MRCVAVSVSALQNSTWSDQRSFVTVNVPSPQNCPFSWAIWTLKVLHAKFHPHWCNDKGVGPRHNWKFHWSFTKFWNVNALQRRIPCVIFTKFAEFVPCFKMRYLLKFGWICSRGYGVMGIFKVEGWIFHKFSDPPCGEIMRRTPKVLEVQERARGPLSPCQVWWGSGFTCCQASQKRWVFCLSVCLSRYGDGAGNTVEENSAA